MMNDNFNSYVWNGEGQVTSTAGVTYSYDGDGKRVEKSGGTIYWYGMNGDALDETDLSGSMTNSSFSEYVFFGGKRIARRDSSGNVFYYVADHLGTSRAIAEVPSGQISASLCYDADFLPYGQEVTFTSSCGSQYKFTGKERDTESGLDNFGARYNSSSIGRFMSPDPIYIEEQKLVDPQQLNLYSYVRNNPLNLTDPTGMLVDLNCQQVTTEQCSQTVTDFNNRKGAQFQVTRDDKTGQLNVSGNVDPTKLSPGERALYDAITNKDATGTLTVVGKDSSFDFEESTGKGHNSLDRSDLNAMNSADKNLSGEIIAHAALESYDSAKPGVSVDQAHDFARRFFGFEYGDDLPELLYQRM